MKIISIKPVTPRTVYAIKTSTSTFIADGLAHHNCDYCNSQGAFGLKGDYGNYMLYLVKEYGLEHAEELQRLKGTTKVYKLHDFIDIKAEYEQKTKDLYKI